MFLVLAQTAASQVASTPVEHGFSYYCSLSFLYGIIEGLTEFLPVSSTAHLRIAEMFTGIDMKAGYWKMYSVVIQLGAILSVPILFRSRIQQLIKTFPKGESGNKTIYTHPLSLVIIGFLVTVGPCYLADKKIGQNLENMLVMALALLIGGGVMWVVDFLCARPKIKRMEEMTILNAVWIGAVQVVSAIFPGTSRSMCTIAAGQVVRLSRATALEYSFFLSLPTMLAATGYKLLQALATRPKTAEAIAEYNAPHGQWVVLGIGFIVSFLVALVVNKWFINWVKERGFAPFAIYRMALGIGMLMYLDAHL